MAVTVQMQFESAVTETYQKAFVGSSIENGATIIQFDLRQLDFQRELGTTSPICWRQDVSHVDIHELSTFHNPIKDRFLVAQGYYLNDQQQRVYFKQVLRSLRRNALPVKRIDRPLLMRPEHLAGALVERREIAKTSSRANGVLHHTPEAFDRIEMMATMGR
jgi:hypothetical protein